MLWQGVCYVGSVGNAWFNSTCYHPPRAYPREFDIFFLLGGLFPAPGHEKGDNSPPPGLLSTSAMSLCVQKRVTILVAFLEFISTGRIMNGTMLSRQGIFYFI